MKETGNELRKKKKNRKKITKKRKTNKKIKINMCYV